MMAVSILSPPTLTDRAYTISARDKTATSVVPPPISTTIDPVGSVIGIPAPIAAAIGSAIKPAFLAPAERTDSLIALFSTGVAPCGTQTTIFGFAKLPRL